MSFAPYDRAMLDARFSHLCQSFHTISPYFELCLPPYFSMLISLFSQSPGWHLCTNKHAQAKGGKLEKK